MASRNAQRQVRQRKLSTKANLPIFREGEIELLPVDDDAARNIPKIETGVEKAEETEHHLQAIIQQPQAGSVGQLYIPTRDTTESALNYDQYYHGGFTEPHSYIRFSSTVEDCVGAAYCMNEDDALWLDDFNKRKHEKSRCSEHHFESVMNFFEETAKDKQPYSSVGDVPVLPLSEMETSPYIDDEEVLPEEAKKFVNPVYKHWELQRQKRLNQPLMPMLKFEKNMEADESDPYVCFRRREHRQVRKTRGRDAQVMEKIKRLRIELEQARQLINHVKAREFLRKTQLDMDKKVFEHRAKVKDAKRHLGIKGDDEDLVNQKPSPKPKPMLPTGMHRLPPGAQFPGNKSLLNRSDSSLSLSGVLRASDADYVQLEDVRKSEADKRKSAVDENKTKHRAWNNGWADATWRPITPPIDDQDHESDVERDPLGRELRGWRRVDVGAAVVEAQRGGASLPTPPESIASPLAEDHDVSVVDGGKSFDRPFKNTRSRQPVVRMASPPPDAIRSPDTLQPETLFRKRTGRNGRQYIDRRTLKRSHAQSSEDTPSIYDSHLSLARNNRPYNFRQKRLKQSSSERNDDDPSSPFGSVLSSFEALRDERFRYDHDSDDEEEEGFAARMYVADPTSNRAMFYRTMWARNAQQEAAAAQQALAAQQGMSQQQITQMHQARIARMSGPGVPAQSVAQSAAAVAAAQQQIQRTAAASGASG